MKIDFEIASSVLEEEIAQIQTIQISGYWVDVSSRLGKECLLKNKTMIAMLGTALLAKATNPLVDVFALQVGESKDLRTYSARALCKEVLAANANRLGIDLGVRGREPLNNQPFFGKARISGAMKVRSDAQVALEILLEALGKLDGLTTQKQARNALRSFLQTRKRDPATIIVPNGSGEGLDENDFVDMVTSFVASDSEGGRRAQAVATGLLDLFYGKNRVVVNKINDPGRTLPGDIGILSMEGAGDVERVFEVKDKPITARDIDIFLDTVFRASLCKAGMLSVSPLQEPLDIASSIRWAEARNIRLRVFIGWEDIVKDSLFWSEVPGLGIGAAIEAIASRLEFFEVSEEGIRDWVER